MSRKFLTGIDLNKNSLIAARIENLGTAPSTPVVGQVYFDTTGGVLRAFIWDGAVWQRASFATDPFARANHTGTQLSATVSDLATTVQAYRLDQFVAPNVDLSVNTHKVINVLAGTAATDAVNKSQLDSVAAGLDPKASVRAASTANLSITYTSTNGVSARGQITAAPAILDGVSLATNDRILIKDQTVGWANGIWVVSTLGTGANGVWDRATDFDTDPKVTSGAYVFVEEGTANDNSGWVLNTNNPITIGGSSGTALVWSQFTGAGSLVAGTGLLKTANTIDAQAGATPGTGGPGGGLVANADDLVIDRAIVVRKFAASFGDGAALAYTITHGLNTQDVTVAVYDNTTPFAELMCDVEHATVNTVILRFAVAPTANQYRVAVQG